jgi:hypothetical protein
LHFDEAEKYTLLYAYMIALLLLLLRNTKIIGKKNSKRSYTITFFYSCPLFLRDINDDVKCERHTHTSSVVSSQSINDKIRTEITH